MLHIKEIDFTFAPSKLRKYNKPLEHNIETTENIICIATTPHPQQVVPFSLNTIPFSKLPLYI